MEEAGIIFNTRAMGGGALFHGCDGGAALDRYCKTVKTLGPL